MAIEGVQVEVEDGFARIEFLDPAKRGTTVAKLLEVGGPGLIDVDTRSGRRKIYRVPESIAEQAGLIDDKPKKVTRGRPGSSKSAPAAKADDKADKTTDS